MKPSLRVPVALAAGLITQTLFAAAIVSMALGLACGLRSGLGVAHGAWGLAANLFLAFQFPVLHSWLLSSGGSRWLAPKRFGAVGLTLWTSSFAVVASAQLLLTFWLWTPSHIVLYSARGPQLWMHACLLVAAWAFLAKSIWDGDARVQSGALGWSSLLAGRAPRYRDFPTHGAFAGCRQPIYLGFALCLWVGPVVTLDKLLLATIWTGYCLLGPRFKEARYARRYGERYLRYREGVPYIVPRFRP